MARERMVTRTVSEYVVTAMTVNVNTKEVVNAEYSISATIPEEKVLTFIQKHFTTTDIKIVAVLTLSVRETLYGMPEVDFIKYAKVLPPRFTTED